MFLKKFALFAALFCAFSAVKANDIYVADCVLDPNATDGSTVTVYLELTSVLNNKAVSIDLILPTGYEAVTDAFGDPEVTMGADITYAMAQPSYSGQRLKLSSIGTKVLAGKHVYATCKIKALPGAESGTITLENRVVALDELPDSECTANVISDLTIGKGGYSSYSVCAPVKVTGATVKFATLSGTTLTLSGDGNIVPANTGVILKGTEGATVTLEAVDSDFSQASALSPSVLPTPVAANSTMVLSTGSQGTGFYVFTGTTITANKAYLASVPTSAPLRIVEDETTGIEEVESEANVGFNYNLMGQQIKSQKGFAIENGKKVVRF